MLLIFVFICTTTSFIGLSDNINPVSGQIVAEHSNWITSIWRRKPKRPRGARGEKACFLSPGLIDTYIVWSNRPLFLWQYSGNNKKVDLIVREFESKQDVWKKSVNLTDKKVFYSAEKSLEPGKIYQWRLSISSSWVLFKIMSADERQNVQEKLQALEKKSKNTQEFSEEIALKKAEFFFNYEIKNQVENKNFNAWSDALSVLYKVENPSLDFVENRGKLVDSLCSLASR